MKRLVIQWPRLGPYHLARLRATHALCAKEGVELIALETASLDSVYAWREEQQDVPFERVQVFPGKRFEDVTPAEMRREVTKQLDRIAPDAVAIHTYSFPDSRACVAWCRRNRKGAVVMTDSKADDAERSAPREFVKRLLLGAYDAAVTAGTRSRDYLTHLGFPGDAIWLGYDVVDNDYFAERAAAAAAAEPPAGVQAPYFLASNRFIARKNLSLLLKSYDDYRARAEQPWPLVMLGDGPLRSQLEADAGEGVVFAGFRQIDEIPTYYAHAGAFVHPALVDQWALVINEAMAAGLPVIASTGAGATHDLVQSGKNGFRFLPQDWPGLTKALVQMASADRDSMANRSREIIAEWGTDLFASSMLTAARKAAVRGNRPFALPQRATLTALRLATRSTTSFHAIES
jgi:1,2-diacylglycerol 3-alpha-glucosyltransferase